MTHSCILGITGKIGSGKHTVARILEKQGFVMLDADKMAHELYVRGSEIWHQLVDTFGKKILDKNCEICRSKLGRLVFNNSEKLAQLNQIVHPELRKAIKARITKLHIEHHDKIVIVAALAEELGLKELADKVILVSAPLKYRVELLRQNRGMSEKEVLVRNERQKEFEGYDVLIENQGSLEELEEITLQTIKEIC